MTSTRERAQSVKPLPGRSPGLNPRSHATLSLTMPYSPQGHEGAIYDVVRLDLAQQTDRRILGGWFLDGIGYPSVAVAVTSGGCQCSCHDGRRRTGCEHVRALLKYGLISHPGRVNVVHPDLRIVF